MRFLFGPRTRSWLPAPSRRGATAGHLPPFCLAALLVAGCASSPQVARVYDGRVVHGPFVPAEAYGAYLRGVLAEEAGDDKTALAAFEEAAREDEDEDPEPLVRIGAVRCRLDPKGRGADDAFARAAKLDAQYAPLLSARARCAAQRGQVDAAIATVATVGAADREVSTEALFVTLSRDRDSARSAAIALTVASGEHVAAWDALLAWGRAHGDAVLVAQGLIGLLKVSPLRVREVESGAITLLGEGHTGAARMVAAAVADASPDLGLTRVADPTVARLAVDEALVRGDGARAEQRGVRGHVSSAEIAGRALLLEQEAIALPLARRVLDADPSNSGAAMVLAASSRVKTAPATDRAPAACALALASRLDVEAARTFLERVGPAAIPPHDPVVGPIAVELAVRGALPEAPLPPDLRLEVIARRREAPSQQKGIDPDKLDAKHALLFHSLVDPMGAPARALLKRLASAQDHEPLVIYALVRAVLAAPQAPNDGYVNARSATAVAPMDPLVAAVAVELAKRSGRTEDMPHVRARLMAVARTPAERALASSE